MKFRREADRRNALRAFVENPDDERVQRNALMLDPQTTTAIMRQRRQSAEWKRDDDFREGYTDYLTSAPSPRPQGSALSGLAGPVAMPSSGGPGATGIVSGPSEEARTLPGTGQTISLPTENRNALLGPLPDSQRTHDMGSFGALDSQPMPGQPSAEPDPNDYRAAIDKQARAFARMAKADPVKAQAAQKQFYADAKGRLELMDAVYSEAYEELAGVSDEAGYQRILNHVHQQFAPYGVDIRTVVPPNFPGEKGIRELRMRALDAKDQLVAADRHMRLQWDIEDDIYDNDRADRSADSLIANRQDQIANRGARLGLARQRENRIATTPRGSGRSPAPRAPTLAGEMAPIIAKVKRGEALTAGEQQAWQMYRPGRSSRGGSGGGAMAGTKDRPIPVSDPKQVERLAPGTYYSANGKTYLRK